MVNLFLNHYIDRDIERLMELLFCFKENQLNKSIGYIIVISEEAIVPLFESRKNTAIIVKSEARPTFEYYFETINKYSKHDYINIISNGDIIFDELAIKLIIENIKENEVYCLSRWDINKDTSTTHFNRRDSYDSYVFRGKPKEISDCNFTLGLAGNDDSIAERFQRAGYVVKNPSMDIKTYHLHLSGKRNYNPQEPTPKPYLLITPHTLGETNIEYHKVI